MDSTSFATTGASSGTVGPPDVLGTLISSIAGMFSGAGTGGGLGQWLLSVWSVYTILAYIISFILLYLFIFASIRIANLNAELEAGVAAQRAAYLAAQGTVPHQSQWRKILGLIDSTNPNDWKSAIMEADILLDESLQKAGYGGTSLGERLRSISPQTLTSLDEAWTAHKVRNQVAHSGPDFILTQRMTKDTISRYRVVLSELGIV